MQIRQAIFDLELQYQQGFHVLSGLKFDIWYCYKPVVQYTLYWYQGQDDRISIYQQHCLLGIFPFHLDLQIGLYGYISFNCGDARILESVFFMEWTEMPDPIIVNITKRVRIIQ